MQRGQKAITPVVAAARQINPVFAISGGARDAGSLLAHSTTTGATTTAPVRSPSHHVGQIELKLLNSAWPASVRLLTPIVALTTVAARLISANLATPIGVSKTCSPSAQCLTR